MNEQLIPNAGDLSTIQEENTSDFENKGHWAASLGSGLRSLALDRTILMLATFFCVALAVMLWHLDRLSTRLVKSNALQHAASYSGAVSEFRKLYTSEVVQPAREIGVEVTHNYKDKVGAIPLPSTLAMLVGNRIAQHETGGETRLYSAFPFPWRKEEGGLRDEFSRQAWIKLNQNPDHPYYRTEEVSGQPILRYATADIMEATCVSCHNSHPDSPRHDWKIGDVRGVIEVAIPMEHAVAQTSAGLRESFVLMLVMGAMGLSCLAIVIGRLRRSVEKHKHVELQAEVAERKRTEEKLLASTQMLEQSNSELQDFAHVASHDLQEPLRKVRAFGSRLRTKYSDDLEGSGIDYLDRMENATSRMQTLINDLLGFSRVTTKAQPFKPVDLEKVVREVCSDLEIRIEQEGGRVDVQSLPTIDADPLQMRQLFQNLIGNALKFHKEGEPPVVTIGIEHCDLSEISEQSIRETDSLCRIRIEDNGIGFEQKYADRIFSVFQRLHGRSEYEGTGIGLSICRKIADRHGGSITVESTPGEGTTFHVTLPMKQPQEEPILC